jgi:subtilase family serine protease
MKKLFLLFAISGFTAAILLAQGPGNGNGYAYGYNGGIVVVPGSSVENPADVGRKAHTNHVIFLRASGQQGYVSGLTPADIATAYTLPALSGAGTIAVVDAYHYPNALADLKTFSKGDPTLGFVSLTPPCEAGSTKSCFNFSQVYASASGVQTTTAPPVNCGWSQEAALDIEWAHAMAPNASIVLVEAQSSSYADLFGAITVAANIVRAANGSGEVSMSWGGSEFSGELNYDPYFQSWPNVVFIASSGDTGGKTIYPSVSPYVIAAGGTTLQMTGSRGTAKFSDEIGWSGSGGGTSAYEPLPDFQSRITQLGAMRGVPDFSFDADPSTGVLVYGPTCSGDSAGWMIFGGTSVSAPSLAGIINSASSTKNSDFSSTTRAELSRIYALSSGQYRDIIAGRAGKFKAVPNWDFVTGIGTPLTLAGK